MIRKRVHLIIEYMPIAVSEFPEETFKAALDRLLYKFHIERTLDLVNAEGKPVALYNGYMREIEDEKETEKKECTDSKVAQKV